MLVKGQIFATSDIGVVESAANNGYKLIYIGDSMEKPAQYPFTDAVVFSPNYNCICAVIEDDIPRFEALYLDLLSAPPAQELFAIILAALANGSNILIYFNKESLQLKYPYVLMTYFLNQFGIRVGDKSSPFSYDERYDPAVIRQLYLFRLIGWKEYLMKAESVDPLVLIRLREDLCVLYNISQDINDIEMTKKVEEIQKYLINNTNGDNRLFSTVAKGD